MSSYTQKALLWSKNNRALIKEGFRQCIIINGVFLVFWKLGNIV
jgi:hypothetical protein